MNEQMQTVLKRFGIMLLIIVGTILGLFLIYKLSFYLAPFIIAYALSSIMEPLIKCLTAKTRLKRKPAALISLLIMLSTIGLVVTMIVIKLISELKSLYNTLPQYYDYIYSSINALINRATDLYFWLPIEISSNLGSLLTNIPKIAVDMLNTLAKSALATAISIPQVIVFILAAILSTYFLAVDRENIRKTIRSQLPDAWVAKASDIKHDMFSALFGYIRAQLILMTITFTELSIAFSIIGISQPILIALLISLMDALPILGAGGVLVPWSIFAFIIGDIRIGVSILITYLVVLVVRQLIEPKILGQQIGMHPLVTLVSMYTGLRVLGVIGLIVGPVSVLLIFNVLRGIYKDNPFKGIIKS